MVGPDDTSAPDAPARRTVATYNTYREAERAVDHLSDSEFDVSKVVIVGTGLRYVERVAGRVTTSRAALMGIGQGAIIGLLFALLFGIFFTGPEFWGLLAYGVVAGALFGAVFGALAHMASGGQRDFASVAGQEAETYEIQVESGAADEAERLLASLTKA